MSKKILNKSQMKNLLMLLILVTGLTIVSESYSQTFGIKAGLNLSNMRVKDNCDTYSDVYKMNPGFNVGGIVEFPLTEMFSVETNLILATKGFIMDEEVIFIDETITEYLKINLLYLDISITAKALFDIGYAKIYSFFGPYIWNRFIR